jgi:hypothetical protein
VIENALGEVDGVASEYYYLEEIFGQRDVSLFLETRISGLEKRGSTIRWT